tara:strand:+ start:39 stop:332 length:294 start_codon:yes stop_codon:yes gene_type:complete
MNLQEKTLVFRFGEDNNLSDLKINSEIKHFIADLRGVTPDLAENIKNKFIIFANNISKMNGSFVVVCEFYFDEELTIVPSLQEAYDYIEMEEIERQL